ncbi:pyridoxal-phosphate dependent enzyme [Salinactinospora qingdaonensis]|uniref:Pyridoxal-phosphate dependent enzyme n=1 Tax=Salinactinospora qingdaonensis TaxID=702744 RepID=A0ABP7FP24_9ACTN
MPSPLVEVADERLRRRGVRLLLKRDDLIDAEIPGNKWRKLQPNLAAARRQGHRRLLTFGGAYSNHIRAVAAAGHRYGLATIGVIRGEEHTPLNWSLSYAARRGMRLVYLDRATYRRNHTPEVIDRFRREYGSFYLVPEGGSNALAVRGAMAVPAEVDEPFDVICCPVGTGATVAGIAAGLAPPARAVGFSVLKGGDFLAADVARLQDEAGVPTRNWRIETGFHFGGFAKQPPELAGFVDDFAGRHGITLEWVYVAKMLAGVFTMAQRGDFTPGTTVVAVVTG